jgi:outer membrane protein assembly factor BamB
MMRILLLVSLLTLSQIVSAWTTYQNTPSHTGYVPVQLDTSSFHVRWQAELNYPLNPVTVGDGKVFVSTVGYFSGQLLYSLDSNNGSVLWSHDFGSINSVNPPAYFDHKVYIQTGNHADDTYLRAFDANTGDLIFQSAHAAQWERYFAPTIFENVVYVNGGYYGGMYAFDAQNGQQAWFDSLDQYDQWTPAVNADAVYAYVGGKLTAADKATGSVLYEITDPGFEWSGWSMNLTPVLGDFNDSLVINSGRLVRFDLATQSIAYALSGNFSGEPSVAKGNIYAVSSNSLTSRDEQTGALQWSWIPETQDTLIGTMIVTDSHVLISGQNNTYAVNLVTHSTDWTYPASGALALSDGVLYIAGTTGTVVAIDIGLPPDTDGDGDGDGVSDMSDNCPATPNPDQMDTDGNGIGDVCNDSLDQDADEWTDRLDNCPIFYNPDQSDIDKDGVGDVCDPYPNNPNNLGACLQQVTDKDISINLLMAENAKLKAALQETKGDKDNHHGKEEHQSKEEDRGKKDHRRGTK